MPVALAGERGLALDYMKALREIDIEKDPAPEIRRGVFFMDGSGRGSALGGDPVVLAHDGGDLVRAHGVAGEGLFPGQETQVNSTLR